MTTSAIPGSVQQKLNRALPVAKKAGLGDVLAELITAVNAHSAQLAALTTKYNTELAKLDTAAVAGSNNAATNAAPAYVATTVVSLEQRTV